MAKRIRSLSERIQSAARTKKWVLDNPKRKKESDKRYYDKNREKCIARASVHAVRNRRKKIGVGQDEFDAMLLQQDGKCAICSEVFSETAHVDHNHNTGKARQLLCRRCNVSLGLVKEDIKILNGMIGYINRHASEVVNKAYPGAKLE